jgi:N4-gp56 family major capsid protein
MGDHERLAEMTSPSLAGSNKAQFCDVKDASQQGRAKGDTFHWNIFSDVATAGTTLAETNTVPETNFTISQGTLTITEGANSVPYSGKLDDLSAQPVREIINKVLKNDARKFFDGQAYAQFDACKLRVWSTSTTTTTFGTAGTASASNTAFLSHDILNSMVDYLKERNIPPYTGDDYYFIAHPTTLTGLRADLESIFQYTTEGFQRLANGEIGRYANVRFVEQTGQAKATWAQGKSNWGFMFGEDTVAEAIAVPEEMRGKIPSDYGRSRGIAWYYLGGFGIIHTAAAQTRILKWDSAG